MDIVTRSTLIEKIKAILDQEHNLAQSALSFCLSYEAVSTVIPGNATIAQLENNLKSVNTSLSKDLVEKLETFYQNEVKPLHLPW
jgi:aryl-alcohol dehydrogenase-like predicted oxidoreductase